MLTKRDEEIADRMARAVMVTGISLVVVTILSAAALMVYGVYLVIA